MLALCQVIGLNCPRDDSICNIDITIALDTQIDTTNLSIIVFAESISPLLSKLTLIFEWLVLDLVIDLALQRLSRFATLHCRLFSPAVSCFIQNINNVR